METGRRAKTVLVRRARAYAPRAVEECGARLGARASAARTRPEPPPVSYTPLGQPETSGGGCRATDPAASRAPGEAGGEPPGDRLGSGPAGRRPAPEGRPPRAARPAEDGRRVPARVAGSRRTAPESAARPPGSATRADPPEGRDRPGTASVADTAYG
ncbi:hypothetical protein [Streptomyces atrovirens]|uniref:Uncharacterized protein n=1 Tax=Streptomyces atrovirens TaxID=285556 RepID=A0ABW0DYF5_9ACTN